jgi:hypothetical protein
MHKQTEGLSIPTTFSDRLVPMPDDGFLKNPEHVELCGQQKMSENVVVIDDALG